MNFFKLNKTTDEEKNTAISQKNTLVNKEKKKSNAEKQEEEYPIYFKDVNVSPSEMKLNFFNADDSLLNIVNASIKIDTFQKANKFYYFQDVKIY